MLRLLDLPNELLLEVIQLVVPEGIEQFTLSSKEIYHLGRDTLISHRCRKQYGVVNCSRAKDPDIGSMKHIQPLRFLANISLDEAIAAYTTELTIGRSDVDKWGLFLDNEEQEQLHTVWLSAKIESCPYLKHEDVDSWTADILSGFLPRTYALLVTLLPNLRSLTIIEHFRLEPSFSDMVSNIARVSTQGDHVTSIALGKLSELCVNDRASYPSESLNLCAEFAALPSMRSLQGHNVLGSDFLWPSQAQISGITSIRFSGSSVNADSFTELFRGMKALEVFVYEQGARDYGQTAEENPADIVDGLLLHAKSSLRRMDITRNRGEDFDDECYFLVSLDAFEVLRWIRLDVELLFIEDSDEVDVALPAGHFYTEEGLEDYHYGYEASPLVDTLPSSVETLELVGVLSEANTASMLARLPELKEERLPRLKKIIFEGHYAVGETITTECSKVGIKLEHQKPAWYTRMIAQGLQHYW